MRLRTAIQVWVFCVSAIVFPVIAGAAGEESPETSIARDQLAAACRSAKAEFHAITQSDVAETKRALLESLDRLDERLTLAGAGGDDWRKYLQWDALQESLRSEQRPDLKLLAGIHSRYTAGYDGLELVWFLDVQRALRSYIVTVGAVDDPQVRAATEKVLDKLAANLDAYLAKPTTEGALAITESVRWLQNAHQSPELIKAIQKHLAQPNVIGEVSAGASLAEHTRWARLPYRFRPIWTEA